MKFRTLNVIFFFYVFAVGIVALGASNTFNYPYNRSWTIDPSLLFGTVGIVTLIVSAIFLIITLTSKEETDDEASRLTGD